MEVKRFGNKTLEHGEGGRRFWDTRGTGKEKDLGRADHGILEDCNCFEKPGLGGFVNKKTGIVRGCLTADHKKGTENQRIER